MTNVEPMCMEPPKKKLVMPNRTIISILFVGMILLMFLIPPPPLIDKSPVAFIYTIEDQVEIDSLIETQDGGFAFVVAERPACEDLHQGMLRGIASFIRTDRNGIILWNVTLPIGNPTDVYFPKMHSTMYTSGEGIPQPHYIHETVTGNFLITSFSGVKPLLIKISVSGEVLWIQDSLVDIVSNHDDYGYINRIIETSDGKFLIQGAMMGPLIWLSHSFRDWIVKIDKHGIREWSLNISGEPQYDVYGNFWGYSYGLKDFFLSSANDLYVYTSSDNINEQIIKFSDEGNFEWKKSVEHYSFDHIYHTKSGFLEVNNTRLVKRNFDGELDWVTDYDWNWNSAYDWYDPQIRFFITEEEYFIVGRINQGQTDAINGSLYMYRIAKVNTKGSILWQIEKSSWEKPSDPYDPFPVYLTSLGLLIVTNDLIIVKSDGSVNTRSFNPGTILKTLNYETELENHTYCTIYQISNDRFLKMSVSNVTEWIGYFHTTVEISCFDINTNSLWQKNIIYSFSQDNAEIPHKYRITTDNDLVMMVKEYNNTNSDHPILFMKITEQGRVPWIYRYTFTSIDPLCVNITKIDSSNLGVPVNSTNWLLPFILGGIIIGGMVSMVILTQKRLK